MCKQPQDAILQLLAVALARTVTAVQLPTDRADCGKLKGAHALATALGLDMANWWTPDGDHYLARVKREQIFAAIEGIRLTNYTADHGAGLLGLLSIRPCGGGEFSDSVNWKVAQPWQD